MSLLSRNKKKKSDNPSFKVQKNEARINSAKMLERLKSLNLQHNQAVQNRTKYEQAVQQINGQITSLYGAIEQMNEVLHESGFDLQKVYEQFTSEIEAEKKQANDNIQTQ